MAYEQHEWVNGETITAEKMNNIEEGIAEAAQSGGSGALICNSSYDGDAGNYILDKTAQEIYDALLAGTPVYIKYQYGTPEAYSGSIYLAPVIRFTNYDYTNVLHIYASKPMAGTVSNKPDAGLCGVLVYSASGLDNHPAYDNNRTTVVNNSSMVLAGVE